MKKLLVFFGVLALLAPFTVRGAEVQFKTPYYLNQGEVLDTNLYFGGESAYIAGTVNGDVVAGGGVVGIPGDVGGNILAAGGRISVTGKVSGSIFAAGGTIDVSGSVRGSVRVLGGTVTVSGVIGGDLAVGGGQVQVLPGAVIQGDLILGGGKADIQGIVNGNAKSAAREVNLNGSITGETDFNVENLSLGPKAALSKGLTYRSYSEANIDPSAKIVGGINFDRRQVSPRRVVVSAIFGVGALLKFLMFLAAGLVFAYFFKKSTTSIVRGSMSSWEVLWKGFAFLVLTPILAVILMVTVIGIPLGVLAFLVYGFVLLVACVLAEVAAGAWLQRWIWKKEDMDWKTVLLGTAAFLVLGWIPFVGWLATFVLFLSVLGASQLHFHKEIWSNR